MHYFFSKSLWIHYLLRDFTRNSSSFSRIRELPMNSLSSLNSLSFPRIFFTNSLWWIHYLFCDFTLNSPTYYQNHYECNNLSAKLIWIHYLLRDFTMNSLYVSRIHPKFIVFRQITLNSLSALCFTVITLSFFCELTICFADSPWIHYLFREIPMISLWNNYEITLKSQWNLYKFTFCFAILLRIYYLL